MDESSKKAKSDRDWESIPEDIWIAILLKCQPKEFRLMRCVSTYFTPIVDSTCFALAYYGLPNIKKPNVVIIDRPTDDGVIKGGLYVSEPGNVFNKIFNFRCPVDWVDVVGCVKGLVLLHKFDTSDLLLWNPLTDKIFPIPKSPLCEWYNRADRNDQVRVSFGFDGVDFKVVVVIIHPRLRKMWPDPELVLEVYSLRTDKWERNDHDQLFGCDFRLGPMNVSAHADGIYWLVSTTGKPNCEEDSGEEDNGEEYNGAEDNLEEGADRGEYSHVLYLNLHTERLHSVRLASSLINKPVQIPLLYEDSYSVYGMSSQKGWLLELKDGSGWSTIHQDDPQDIEKLYEKLVGQRVNNAICFVHEETFELLISLKGGGLVSYNMGFFALFSHHDRASFAGLYTENLLPASDLFPRCEETETQEDSG